MAQEKAAEDTPSAEDLLGKIIEAAERLGVEVDKTQATQWLASMAAGNQLPDDWAVDARDGFYGHRVALLDFSPEVLERYRRIAAIVEIPDRPGVETAISLSGSAAQSQVQLFPGDADFFERVNIQAPTREQACRILADVMHTKALATFKGETYQLIEVKWGTFVQDAVRDGQAIKAGKPMSWNPAEVREGRILVSSPSGEPMTVEWEYGCQEPGWCKLDWLVVEPEKGGVVHASNMLDVTWEGPDGGIVPLDGFLDPYFQEVYLDAESIPLFTKLSKHLSPDALQAYVAALKHEVIKYSQRDPRNFGKVAKRLYNIFRLEGHWAEAAYIRELFDEPAALLYQVSALLDTVEEALNSETAPDRDTLTEQVDGLIRSVVRVCEGAVEEKLVDALLRLRDDVSGRRGLGPVHDEIIRESNRIVGELVNEFFRDRLLVMPEVRLYIESLAEPST